MELLQKKRKVCLITFPISEAGCIPLQNLSNIILELFPDFYMITGSKGYELFAKNKYIKTYEISHKPYNNSFLRILTYIYTQIKILIQLVRAITFIDMVIFFIGGETLILPILFSKLFGKKIILVLPGSTVETLEGLDSKDLFKDCARFLSRINYRLSTKIVVYSSSLVKRWHLEEFSDKISIVSEHSINLEKFRIIKPFNQRKNVIGFVGRFSYEKGILNFINSISDIVKKFPSFYFIIIGEGPLKLDLQIYIKENDLKKNILMTGWIPHDELVRYLNEMKILVIPSYTEGLPNVMLEAMACGTPVVANNVGSIPDVIINDTNGIILEDNDSTTIAKSIIKAMAVSNLENMSFECVKTIENNFKYDLVVERWKKVLYQI